MNFLDQKKERKGMQLKGTLLFSRLFPKASYKKSLTHMPQRVVSESVSDDDTAAAAEAVVV